MVTIVSWNMQNKSESWRFLLGARHDDYDFAFISESCDPRPRVGRTVRECGWDIPLDTWDTQPGETRKRYRQEVLGIRSGWQIERLDRHAVVDAAPAPPGLDQLPSIFRRWHRATVVRRRGEEFCLVCVVSGHRQAQSLPELIEGVRSVLEDRGSMPMIVAGDLTTNGDKSEAMFSRMKDLGLPWVGPTGPNYIHVSGRKPHQRETPADAHRHLNHVFATAEIADRVSATALNSADEDSGDFWGPSDHCRVSIEVR